MIDKLAAKMMAAARRTDNPCIRCGATGTTCGRHYNGIRQHKYGKGRGIKCHPFLVADLCAECDKEFQEGTANKGSMAERLIYSEEFQHWCLMSLIRRQKEGYL